MRCDWAVDVRGAMPAPLPDGLSPCAAPACYPLTHAICTTKPFGLVEMGFCGFLTPTDVRAAVRCTDTHTCHTAVRAFVACLVRDQSLFTVFPMIPCAALCPQQRHCSQVSGAGWRPLHSATGGRRRRRGLVRPRPARVLPGPAVRGTAPAARGGRRGRAARAVHHARCLAVDRGLITAVQTGASRRCNGCKVHRETY